jgi:hypothetical protein
MSKITAQILDFLQGIGMQVEQKSLPGDTFLPGISAAHDVLFYDEEKLLYPGDLLHEAGHLAILPPDERAATDGDFGKNAGYEMAAIAWSYAASCHLNLPLDLLFHAKGYKGDSESHIENFSTGHYFGVPILEWRGMSRTSGETPYPDMIHWLCP